MAKIKDKTLVFSEYSIPKAVATLAIPSMIGMLINIIYNLADTFFVGQTGDSNKVAAVSVSMPLFLFFLAIGNLFGVGGCAFISRSLGEGNRDRVKTISSFCLYGSIVVCVVLAIVYFVFRKPILLAAGATENTIDDAVKYLFWVALGSPFVVVSITLGNLIRGEGAAAKSTTGMVIGQIVNIVLDPIFILPTGAKLGFVQLPFGLDLGVSGAAIATVLGNVVSVLFFVIYLTSGKSILSVTPGRFTLDKYIIKGVLTVGLAASVTNLLMSISNILVNALLKKYGDDAVAAMGITMKANMLVVMLQLGLGMGIQPLVGFCYGAKNYVRMKKSVLFGIMCNIIIGTSMTLFLLVFRRQVIGVFIDNENVIEYGVKMLLAYMAPGPVIGILFALNFSFQGMGKGTQSMLLAIGRQGLVFFPLIVVLDKIIGLEGLVWSQPIADAICIIVAILMFVSTVKKLEKEPKINLDD